MRRTDGCKNCGETREMAAHDLCFKCYRRLERLDDQKFAGVDRHTPAIRRDHKKLFRGFTAVMVGLSDLGISKEDVFTIRRTIEPYLSPIAKFLAVTSEKDEGEVNSERDSPTPFTVQTDPSMSREEKPPTTFLIQSDPNMSREEKAPKTFFIRTDPSVSTQETHKQSAVYIQSSTSDALPVNSKRPPKRSSEK